MYMFGVIKPLFKWIPDWDKQSSENNSALKLCYGRHVSDSKYNHDYPSVEHTLHCSNVWSLFIAEHIYYGHVTLPTATVIILMSWTLILISVFTHY